MNPDTQAVLSALKVYEQTLRNNAKDLVSYADILANAAAQLEGTLVTQLDESLAKDATIMALKQNIADALALTAVDAPLPLGP